MSYHVLPAASLHCRQKDGRLCSRYNDCKLAHLILVEQHDVDSIVTRQHLMGQCDDVSLAKVSTALLHTAFGKLM